MFNKIQLTVFALLVFPCHVVIFPIHCDLLFPFLSRKSLEHSSEYLRSIHLLESQFYFIIVLAHSVEEFLPSFPNARGRIT